MGIDMRLVAAGLITKYENKLKKINETATNGIKLFPHNPFLKQIKKLSEELKDEN